MRAHLILNICKIPNRCFSKDKSADAEKSKALVKSSLKPSQESKTPAKVDLPQSPVKPCKFKISFSDACNKAKAAILCVKAAEKPNPATSSQTKPASAGPPKPAATSSQSKTIANKPKVPAVNPPKPPPKGSPKIKRTTVSNGKTNAKIGKRRLTAALKSKFAKSKRKKSKTQAKTAPPIIACPSPCCGPRQKYLLAYPVVPLKETLTRYLRSVEPLLTAEAFQEHKIITEEFEANSGAELQRLLKDAGRLEKNWLAKRWTKGNYLERRTPLTVYSSPCMAFPLQKFASTEQFLNFTAKAIFCMGEFKQLIDRHHIPVVKMEKYELDNSHFSKVFGSVRTPHRFCDSIEQYCNSSHVVVICKNFFYKLPIFNCEGELISAQVLFHQLQHIYNCKTHRSDEIMGVLTHDLRENWAESVKWLSQSPKNSLTLSIIESALFTVSLDEQFDVPKGKELSVQSAQLLHGGGMSLNSANRWMDKTLQLIVNPNGMAGFCFEHSPADCQPIAMLLDFLIRSVADKDYGNAGCQENYDCIEPLQFLPASKCVSLWVNVAQRTINSLSTSLQVHVFKFDCHGKNFIKAQGLSPDSYIQMALQLAFFKVHKKLPAQYESAHLRLFEGGRTETIRSCSKESKHFVYAMSNHKESKNCLIALRAAIDEHQEYTKLALQGRGVDRHLFGLQRMALEHCKKLPEFFESEGYKIGSHFRISSAHVASNHDAFMVFSPLTVDGYGCSYNPRDRDIIFSITTWRSCDETCPKRYGKAIIDALYAMRQLILQTGGDRVADDACKCEKKKT